MPTKLNRAGNQQNYVPAGNGDASGEYGDNATGSNKHFQVFKKPDGDEPTAINLGQQPTQATQEPVKAEESKPDVKASLAEGFKKVNSNYNDEHAKTFNKVIEETNDEAQVLLNKYISENTALTIRFGNAGRNAAGVAMGNSITTNGETHTIRHEMGHTVDSFYGGKFGEKNPLYGWESNLSTHYIDLEEHKTLNQVLHEEIGMHTVERSMEGWKIRELKTGKDKHDEIKQKMIPIYQAYRDLGDSYFDEISGVKNARETLKELRIKYNTAKDNARKLLVNTEEYKAYQEANKAVYKAEGDYVNEQIKKGAFSIIYSQSPEVLKARQIRDNARNKLDEKEAELINNAISKEDEAEITRLDKLETETYLKHLQGMASVIGDLQDYTGTIGGYYPTRGHGDYYFKQRKTDGLAHEIFANLFDIYCNKSDKMKDAIKKALPRTAGVFDRIMKKINK